MYNTTFRQYCDVCKPPRHAGNRLTMQPIPLWETPAEYKERTGREWQGAVWYRLNPLTKGWNVSNIKSLYLIFGSEFKDIPILCASQPCAPPDDYEEGV